MLKSAYPISDSQHAQILETLSWNQPESRDHTRHYSGKFVIGRTEYDFCIDVEISDDRELRPKVRFRPNIAPNLRKTAVSTLLLQEFRRSKKASKEPSLEAIPPGSQWVFPNKNGEPTGKRILIDKSGRRVAGDVLAPDETFSYSPTETYPAVAIPVRGKQDDYIAWVDPEDYERVSQHNWHPDITLRRDGTQYVVASRTSRGPNRKQKILYLSRELIDAKPGQIVLFKDGNSLNCCKANLQVFDNRSESAPNAATKGVRENKSGLRGVVLERGRWSASIAVDTQKISLGAFDTKWEAAIAYNQKALEVFGEYAQLNPIPPEIERKYTRKDEGGLRHDNTSGVTGVFYQKRFNKWNASYLRRHILWSDDKDVAIRARRRVEELVESGKSVDEAFQQTRTEFEVKTRQKKANKEIYLGKIEHHKGQIIAVARREENGYRLVLRRANTGREQEHSLITDEEFKLWRVDVNDDEAVKKQIIEILQGEESPISFDTEYFKLAAAEDRVVLVKKLLPQNAILYGKLGQREWSGSAFRINDHGHLLTCAHCVDYSMQSPFDRTTQIYISYGDTDYQSCKLVAINYELDIAVVAPVSPSSRPDWAGIPSWSRSSVNITPQTAKLGRSNHLQIGEAITKIGSPEGIFSVTTFGSIASTLRRIEDLRSDVFFIDVFIAPGDSGAPVYNENGIVVGVARGSIVSQELGIGGVNYVLAIDQVRDWLDSQNIPFHFA